MRTDGQTETDVIPQHIFLCTLCTLCHSSGNNNDDDDNNNNNKTDG